MAIVVGMVSQKWGVGKNTLARLLAREFAAQKWCVKIADLDISQGTCFQWRARRLESQTEPDVPVEQFGRIDQAIKIAADYDLLIFDGAPHSTMATRGIAQACDLIIIIPTGLAVNDLQPAVTLAHELRKHDVDRSTIIFALCRVGNSTAESEDARTYIGQAGYAVLAGALPEQVAYRRASDEGKALTETRFSSLNEKPRSSLRASSIRLPSSKPTRSKRLRNGEYQESQTTREGNSAAGRATNSEQLGQASERS